jgi:tetratricopeptide (TPR) repeat protein
LSEVTDLTIRTTSLLERQKVSNRFRNHTRDDLQNSTQRKPSEDEEGVDNDDNLFRTLDRIARGSKVDILNQNGAYSTEAGRSMRVESWIFQIDGALRSAPLETTQGDRDQETETQSFFAANWNRNAADTQSIFSHSSILDNTASETASIMSSISRILESSDPRKVGLLFHLGNKRFWLKKWFEAAEFYRQAYNIKREGVSENEELDQQALKIKIKIGAVFGELNKYESAEKTLKWTLSRQKELLGDDHTETQLTQHYYGRVLSRPAK